MAFGIDVAALENLRRPLVRVCLDWTERRHHLAGSLGAALLDMFLDQRWLIRKSDDRRLLVPTAAGRRHLAQHFGIH
jgi:hypothetical protein